MNLLAWRTLRRRLVVLLGMIIAATASGCAFGPRVLEKTHGRYQESVRQVEEEQLLRNLVHLRYNEGVLSLKVSSIATQYELAGAAEARPFFIAPNPSNSNVIFKTFTSILPDLSVSGANRPTITLIPSDNGDAIRKFLTPIPTETLAFLSESSWPVSVIMRLWVERLNGVPNAVSASGPPTGLISDFARFRRLTDLFQDAQDRELASLRTEPRDVEVSGPLPAAVVTSAAAVDAAKSGMEYRPRGDGQNWVLVRKETKLLVRINPRGIDSPEVEEMNRLLNLRPGETHYDVVVAPGNVPDPLLYTHPPSAELRITPRSTSQVYFYLSNGVELPPDHVASGVVRASVDQEGRPMDGRELTRGVFEVHACAGHKPPDTAYVAVKSRGYWYYIDDRDQASKSTMSLVLQLSRLDFGNQTPAAPFLTLPIGR